MESDENSTESHDEQATAQQQQQRSRVRIVVPQRVIGGGLDSKFESDPYDINLYKLLTARDYTASINRINEVIKPARSKSIDSVLLYSGALMVPLLVWGVRHRILMKKRKKLLLEAIDEFNIRHPQLYMRWNRRPLSILTIERRIMEDEIPYTEPEQKLIIYNPPTEPMVRTTGMRHEEEMIDFLT